MSVLLESTDLEAAIRLKYNGMASPEYDQVQWLACDGLKQPWPDRLKQPWPDRLQQPRCDGNKCKLSRQLTFKQSEGDTPTHFEASMWL